MIKRVVLTGGPGSGKTTVIDKIVKTYNEQDYKVIVVPETATELINAGMKPFGENAINMVDFQQLVMKLQLAKESVVEDALKMLKDDNVLVIYDRGTIDNKAYINEEEFTQVLNKLGNVKSFSQLLNKYDLVIDLVASKEFYTVVNNKARSESCDEAIEKGNKTLNAWLGHPKIKIVLPQDKIEDKEKIVLNIINEVLKKEQVKRQEKYLVDLKKSDIDYIKKISKVAEIEQVYLMSESNIEKRIRKVLFNGEESYYFSVFKITEKRKKIVVEDKKIDCDMYNNLKEFKDNLCDVIYKKRYYFVFDGQYFNLDVFDNVDDMAILEVNVLENENIFIPQNLSVLDRVSDDYNYTNRNIASLKKGLNLVKIND